MIPPVGPPPTKKFSRLGRAVKGALGTLRPSRGVVPTASENDQPPIDTKGPLGLNILHDPPEPEIDFIFVHGLGGGSRKTWALSTDHQHFWPKAWLSQDPEFRSVRIHSFGYSANWDEWKKSTLTFLDFARSLLSHVGNNPGIRRSNTRIVFIGHSMGGIVIKKAYILAREDPNLKDLANRIHTLYFLATPHRGSDYSKILANILSVSYGRKPFVSQLSGDSNSIEQINDSFRHVANNVQLWSFYETTPSNLVVTQAIIVDKSSATLGFPDENCYPLIANHRGVCKFHLQTDPNFQVLRNSFGATIDMILCDDSALSPHNLKHQHDQLVELTGISESPDDKLLALENIRIPDSCDWLIKRQSYQSWQRAQPGSRPFFWLTGNAGFGKSILSSRIINELQQKKLQCSYFFFRHGNSDKSTIVGCLRALAYLMARSDSSILHRLLEIQRAFPVWKKWDDKTIWRKWFLECIFTDIGLKTQYWVIDAVDECSKFQSFLNLLAHAPPCLRIMFTSRKNPDIERSLNGTTKIFEHYELQKEDTIGDLIRLIESRMGYIPVSYGTSSEQLKQRILNKASGSFLWASLVIRQLEETYSQEETEDVLSQIPTDMNELYSNMLGKVLENTRAIVLARSIYMWTSLSLRPLKIDGLESVLKLDTDQTVHNLEGVISRISGQLVFVNQKHEAEVVHQTAKEYLLQQQTYPQLALHVLQCHTQIARICLTLLTGNFTKWQQSGETQRTPGCSMSALVPDFTDYTCEYFSDHLQKSSPEDDQNWNLLCKFLDCNVLVWVEYIAEKRRLRSIKRAATNLQAYFRSRLKYLSPKSPQKDSTETWIYDLHRLTAKFGVYLNVSPSSIRNLIPAMCPSDSLISKFHTSRLPQTGLHIQGTKNRFWDDCLARVLYPTQQTSALGCGGLYSAVALSDGTIYLYFQESTQVKTSLDHGAMATILAFSSEDRYLASSGLLKVKVWDPAEGTQLWAVDTGHQSLALLFVEAEDALVAATQGNYTISWGIRTGKEIGRWQWTDALQGTAHGKSWPQPNRASLSPHHATLAVSYRGHPVYLFNFATWKFIGCCSIETHGVLGGARNHYVIDALAFNPRPEVNILVVSYGYGELALYDVESNMLRYRSSDIFAHCLACSPDGQTLVTGTSRGTLRIFEFAGAGGDYLLPLYRINAYEDGVQAITFTNNSLRFADIRGSEYRIWEPTVLACNSPDEGIQSELSHPVSVEMKSDSMLGGEPNPEITVMCCPSSGNFIFCGKWDGTVSYIETSTAYEKGTLYRHGPNIGITGIVFIEARSFLVTADESGRVRINQITLSRESCQFLFIVAEIYSELPSLVLLPSPSNTKLLLRGRKSAGVWTMEGKKVGAMIFFGDDDERTFTNHPLYSDNFVSVARRDIRIFSWTDARELAAPLPDDVNPTVTAPTPIRVQYLRGKNIPGSCVEQWSPPFLTFPSQRIAFTSTQYTNFRVWPAFDIIASSPPPPSIPLHGFANHLHKIRQIISVEESVVFFLDSDLWVCSLDLTTASSISKGAVRHFFILPEWESSDGGFIVQYVPVTRKFLVAKKHEVLVINRALTFEQPWITDTKSN